MQKAFKPSKLDIAILTVIARDPKASVSEIAETLDIPMAMVLRRQQSIAYQMAYEQMFGKIGDILLTAARAASLRLLKLIDDPDPYLAIKAVAIALGPWANSARIVTSPTPNDQRSMPADHPQAPASELAAGSATIEAQVTETTTTTQKVKLYRSTVRFDGSMIQQLIETEVGDIAKAIEAAEAEKATGVDSVERVVPASSSEVREKDNRGS